MIATAFGFLCFRKYAIMELSNPPDSEIKFDLHSLQDSSKILYRFLETLSNIRCMGLKLK
jgi:hypothetical protein